MAVTNISNLWTPEVWIQGVAERSTQMPGLINSGIVRRDPLIDQFAAGGGTQVDLPFFKEPNPDDEIQVESTAPTVNALASGKQVAPHLNRVSSLGATALSGAVAGADPVGFILDTIASVRLRQRQKILLNVLRGAFGTAIAGLSKDSFSESVAGQTADHLIDSDLVLDAIQPLGEKMEDITGGVVIMHSVIETALQKQDSITYIRDSQGNLVMRAYKGLQVFVNDLLSRAGTTDGTVYDTYIATRGSVLMGDKPQSAMIGDAASLVLDGDAAKNDQVVYDRTRSLMLVQGTRWTGTPAGQSPTNAELATAGNWALAYALQNVGVVRLRTNG